MKKMKWIFAIFLCCLVLGAWHASAWALEPVVAPEVLTKLQAADQVPVLILLKERDGFLPAPG